MMRIAAHDADKIRPAEAMALLRISRQTLIAYEARGLLHPERLPSGHRRYRRADVEALLQEREQ